MGEIYPTRLHWVLHESWKPVCSIMECGLSGCSNHKRNSSASDVVEKPNLYNFGSFPDLPKEKIHPLMFQQRFGLSFVRSLF